MTDTTSSLPARLQSIVEGFGRCEGKEKLELLLEFSDRMPLLPDWLQCERQSMEKVEDCMTPVFVHAETKDNQMSFFFDVPPESPSVRGFAALMAEGVQGASPEQVLAIPPDFYLAMGLQEVLSGQRLNGIRAITAYMKRLAQRQLAKAV